MRQFLTVVAAATIFALAAVAPAVGSPAPAPGGTPTASASTLPQGFPAELRQFVGGTDEFKAAPWFSGPCHDRGGDMGVYLDAAFPVEDRLLYWTAAPDQKRALLRASARDPVLGPAGAAGAADDSSLDVQIAAGTEPSALPKVFPAGDPAYRMPTGYCAADLQRWATRTFNTWGFQWAATPDRQSMTEIHRTAGAGDVPGEAWTQPCGGKVSEIYCAHAFFVDCDQADPGADDLRRCVEWNRAVGRLFAGTAHWISANTSLSDRVGQALEATPQFKAAAAYASAFAWTWGTAVPGIVKFVSDPQSVIDQWADAAKESAVDLTSKTLAGLADVGGFDPAAAWFLRWYALSCGIGVMTMGIMTLLAVWRAASKGETIKTIGGDLLVYAPTGVVLMLFAPMLAQLLVDAANALATSVATTAGPDMGAMVDNISTFTGQLTAPQLPGGVIVGLILYLLLIAGALGVFFGLLLHANALPVLAVAAGIGFGMWVHPKWRPKAARPVLVFIAIVLSKPLLFLLLAVESSLIDAELTGRSAAQGNTGTLGELSMIVASLIIVGLAPWTLLRYAPLLPTRSDAAGFGAHSGSMLAGALSGSAMSRMWYGRGLGGDRDGGRSAPDTGRPSAGAVAAAGGTAGVGPRWRTSGSADGRSAREAAYGDMLTRRTGRPPRSGTAPGWGTAGRGAGRLLRGAGGAAALAAPIAASAASAALNKARSAAESGPGEAEQQQ
ncbi:hypothetical protein [Nocardia sp. alder85J]|uniref:hypothetical protein n=1 Tax=Nocardia sp. alder85J TaxID=2862949 RepID=UPI001CD36425|nr:hypothetical protein [Nocardia sp. alder85J]MCX4097699.1 hypothetical protein [Nocardia sp. alder85J]